jgi:hypothetical protein
LLFILWIVSRRLGKYWNDFFVIEGGCPKATFEFKNQTIWASYNFIDSSIGNIGSLETCPCKLPFDSLIFSSWFFLYSIDTGRPYVYLPCYPNSSWGDEPYFSNCFKPIDPIKKNRLNENPYRNLSIEEMSTVILQFFPFDYLKSILFIVTSDKYSWCNACFILFKWRYKEFEISIWYRINCQSNRSYYSNSSDYQCYSIEFIFNCW